MSIVYNFEVSVFRWCPSNMLAIQKVHFKKCSLMGGIQQATLGLWCRRGGAVKRMVEALSRAVHQNGGVNVGHVGPYRLAIWCAGFRMLAGWKWEERQICLHRRWAKQWDWPNLKGLGPGRMAVGVWKGSGSVVEVYQACTPILYRPSSSKTTSLYVLSMWGWVWDFFPLIMWALRVAA